MSKVMRRSNMLMNVGMSILLATFVFSFVALGYVARQNESFESLTQLKNESVLHVKDKLENTKIKFDFSEEAMGFSKYPFNRYYLMIIKKDGKNVAVFAPKGVNNKSFAGRVILRNDNESVNSLMNKYEAEHIGFRFENCVIVAEYTSAMKKVNIIAYILYGVTLVMGIILWRNIKKHYLL